MWLVQGSGKGSKWLKKQPPKDFEEGEHLLDEFHRKKGLSSGLLQTERRWTCCEKSSSSFLVLSSVVQPRTPSRHRDRSLLLCLCSALYVGASVCDLWSAGVKEVSADSIYFLNLSTGLTPTPTPPIFRPFLPTKTMDQKIIGEKDGKIQARYKVEPKLPEINVPRGSPCLNSSPHSFLGSPYHTLCPLPPFLEWCLFFWLPYINEQSKAKERSKERTIALGVGLEQTTGMWPQCFKSHVPFLLLSLTITGFLFVCLFRHTTVTDPEELQERALYLIVP